MNGRTLLVLATFVALLCRPVPGGAQGNECDVVQSGITNIFSSGGQDMIFIGGGARFRCPDGTTISSDSVARFTATGLTEFIGRVRYQDAENLLTANYVRYLEFEKQAIAQGDVVLTDRTTGSVIQGPWLNYYQASDSREESLVRIPSGRPHAVLVSESKADSARRDTTIVDADAMDIIGRTRFEGRGNVDLKRADITGAGGEAWYDRDSGDLRLWRDARLVSEDYTLSGDTVRGRTNELDELDEVTAILNARLDGRDVNIDAPLIHLFFQEGEIDRLVAVGEPRPDEEEAEPGLTSQATATSTDFRLVADSIDVRAPLQKLERVTAVGRAWGERLGNDLANANVPAIAARDWMRGDTVIATFAEVADTVPADSAGTRDVEVDQVIAVGVTQRATSSYRVADEQDPGVTKGINYMLARRIIIHMKAGSVSTVEAAGEVQGIYLQPAAQVGRAGGPGGEGRRR